MADEAAEPAEVPFEDQEVPRETGALKADGNCPVHPDVELQRQDTAYGSVTTSPCPKCAAKEDRSEKAAARAAETERQKGS